MDEQAPNQELRAAELKDEGDELATDKQLAKAIGKFRAAAEIDPTDSVIWQNLSCTYFEVGNYASSIVAAKTALPLVHANDRVRLYRIRVELLTAYIQTQQLDLASQVIQDLGGVQNKWMKIYETTIERLKRNLTAFPDEKVARKKLVNLPRYKHAVRAVSQFSAYGHDEPRPQYDEDLKIDDGDVVSFFFAGIGDARHLYATVLRIGQVEATPGNTEADRKYYFTINDSKAFVFARNLIMLRLLDDLSEQKDQVSDGAVEILNTIFFIFAGTVIPRHVYNRLQLCIRDTKKALRTGQGLPDYLFIHSEDRQDIIDVLSTWQGRNQTFYSTSDAIRYSAELAGKSDRTTFPTVGPSDPPPGCEDELRLYHATGFLQPASSLFQIHDAPLREILMKYRYRVHDAFTEVKHYLATHWRVNVTVVDPEWESDRLVTWAAFRSDPINLGYKLYKFAGIRRPRGCICTQDYVAPYFWRVAQSLKRIKDRLTIEFSLGDFARELEKRRYGLVPERSQTPAPKAYHRVHFGDSLDATGGYLTSFLYGLSMCKTDPGCYITSVCLRTAGSWPVVEHYVNDSVATNNYQELRKTLQAQQVGSVNDDGQIKLKSLPMWSYVHWQRSKSRPHAYSALLGREDFKNWLYRVFFKIVVPYYPIKPVFDAPLNMTIYLRLLARLHELGYSKQRLALVLVDIMEDNVVTSIRPPQSLPLHVNEVGLVHSKAKISTLPFADELATLTSLYQRVLPFAVITSKLAPPQDIYEYTLQLPVVRDGDTLRPVIVLVFVTKEFEDIIHGAELELSIRPMLDFDIRVIPEEHREEVGDSLQHHIKVQTTITLHRQSNKVTFWMKEGLIEHMTRGENWRYGLWRTDDWRKTSQLHDVNEQNVKRGKAWVCDPESSSTGNDGEEKGDDGLAEWLSNVPDE